MLVSPTSTESEAHSYSELIFLFLTVDPSALLGGTPFYKSLCLDNKLQILDSLSTPQRHGEEKGGHEKVKARMREYVQVSQEREYANQPQQHKWV